MSSLAKAAEDVLKQGLVLLSELDAETYALVAPKPYNASLGQHYRHVLDHFLCTAWDTVRAIQRECCQSSGASSLSAPVTPSITTRLFDCSAMHWVSESCRSSV